LLIIDQESGKLSHSKARGSLAKKGGLTGKDSKETTSREQGTKSRSPRRAARGFSRLTCLFLLGEKMIVGAMISEALYFVTWAFGSSEDNSFRVVYDLSISI
jgi:hypothetical protein